MKTIHPFHSTRNHGATALLVATAAVALQFSTIDLFAAPPGGGGGGTTSQPCVLFDDLPSDSVQSDVGDANSPYCNAPKKNITVVFSNDGHLELDSNGSNKTGVGRNFFIDFGAPITVKDPNVPTDVLAVFQTTDELEAAGIKHDANLKVASHQGNFNMLTMALNAVRTDVNLSITLFLHFPTRSQEVPVFTKLAPEILGTGDQCEISDPVTVTCISVDSAGKANGWRVDTQDPNNKACVSQNVVGHVLGDLTIGLRNLSFGFTVTK